MTTLAAPIKGEFRGHEGAEIKVFMVCEDTPIKRRVSFDTPNKIAEFWQQKITKAKWYDPEKEAVVVLCLDRKNKLKAWNLISLGSATNALMHPREVFRPVIIAASTAFVIMHNHPSGDPAPSVADIQVTRAIREAALAVDVLFIDHIVIGDKLNDPLSRGYYSFRQAGRI